MSGFDHELSMSESFRGDIVVFETVDVHFRGLEMLLSTVLRGNTSGYPL